MFLIFTHVRGYSIVKTSRKFQTSKLPPFCSYTFEIRRMVTSTYPQHASSSYVIKEELSEHLVSVHQSQEPSVSNSNCPAFLKIPSIRNAWLKCIFNDVHERLKGNVFVIHFTMDCFLNYSKHAAGFSTHHLLKDVSVASILSSEQMQVKTFILNLTVFL